MEWVLKCHQDTTDMEGQMTLSWLYIATSNGMKQTRFAGYMQFVWTKLLSGVNSPGEFSMCTIVIYFINGRKLVIEIQWWFLQQQLYKVVRSF